MVSYNIPAMRPSMANTLADEYGYNIYDDESYYGKFSAKRDGLKYQVRGIIRVYKPKEVK